MLIIEHSITTKASPQTIWALWQDVSTWKDWDHGIEYVHLNGPFSQGTTGKLKPKGGPPVPFIIVKLESNKSFVDVSQLPLTKLIFSHSLKENQGKTQVTHRVEMKGPLAPLFAFIIGRKMKAELPKAMQCLVQKAETLV